MSYYSKVFYTISSQTAGSKQFTVQFGLESGTPTTNNRPYIHTSHIKVKVDGVSTTDFTLSEATNPSKITFNEGTTLTVGSVIEIYRETPRAAVSRPVDFEDASVLTESDLDLSAVGALYITQEIIDRLETLVPGGGSTAQLLAKKSAADYDIEWVDNALVQIDPAKAGGLLTWNQNGEPYTVAPTDTDAYVARAARGSAAGVTMSKGGIVKIGGAGPASGDGAVGDLWIYLGSGGVDADGNYPGDVFLKSGPTTWIKLYNYTGIGGGDTTTGVSNFTDLLDTPSSTDQQSEKFLYVKPNGDIGFKNSGAVEYLDDVNFNAQNGPTTGDILVWDGALDGSGAWTLSPGVQTKDLDGLAKGSILATDASGIAAPVTPGSDGLFLKSNSAVPQGVEWATSAASGGGLSATALLVQNNNITGLDISSAIGAFYQFNGILTEIQDAPAQYVFSNWSEGPNRLNFGETGFYRITINLSMAAVDAAFGTTASEYPVRVLLLVDTQNGAGLHTKDQKIVVVPSSGGAGPDTSKLATATLTYSGYLGQAGQSVSYLGVVLQNASPAGIASPGIAFPQTVPNPPVVNPGGNYYDERLNGMRILIEKF